MAIKVLTDVNMNTNSINNAVLKNTVAQSLTVGKTIYLTAEDDLQDVIDANSNVILDCTMLSVENLTAPYTITNKRIVFKSFTLLETSGYNFATNLFVIQNSEVEFLDCKFFLDGIDCEGNSSALIVATNSIPWIQQLVFTNTQIQLNNLQNNLDICALDLQNVALLFQRSKLEVSTSDDVFANTINAIKFDAQLENATEDRLEIKFSEIAAYTNANSACTNATTIYFKDTAQDIYIDVYYSIIFIELNSTSARAIYIPNKKSFGWCTCSQLGAIVIAKESDTNFSTWAASTEYSVGDKVKVVINGADTHYVECTVAHTSGETFFTGNEWDYWEYYYVVYANNNCLSSMSVANQTEFKLITTTDAKVTLSTLNIVDQFTCDASDWVLRYINASYDTQGTVKGALDTLFADKQNNLTRYKFTLPADTSAFDTSIPLIDTNLVYINGVLLTPDIGEDQNDYYITSDTILNFRTTYEVDSTLVIIK